MPRSAERAVLIIFEETMVLITLIDDEIMLCRARWEHMGDYLLMKFEEGDYHAVQDAASDLRDLESEIKGLKVARGFIEKYFQEKGTDPRTENLSFNARDLEKARDVEPCRRQSDSPYRDARWNEPAATPSVFSQRRENSQEAETEKSAAAITILAVAMVAALGMAFWLISL